MMDGNECPIFERKKKTYDEDGRNNIIHDSSTTIDFNLVVVVVFFLFLKFRRMTEEDKCEKGTRGSTEIPDFDTAILSSGQDRMPRRRRGG
jgi:hypothetical protein